MADYFSKTPIQPLSNRYLITYSFLIGKGKDYELTDKTGRINQGFTGEGKNTILGRQTPKNSVFSNLQTHLYSDISISRTHFFLEETLEGIVLNDTSYGGTRGYDYQRKEFDLQKADRDIHKNREPIKQLLVPIDYSSKEFDIPIFFGGKYRRKYKLKLTFTPKKLE